MSKLIFIIRHAQTDLNVEEVYYDNHIEEHDISINETGIRQAKFTANYLKHYKPDIMYSSPRLRCIQTSNIIAKKVECKVVENPLLLESKAGKFHGIKHSTIMELSQQDTEFMKLYNERERMEPIARSLYYNKYNKMLDVIKKRDGESSLLKLMKGYDLFVNNIIKSKHKRIGIVGHSTPKRIYLKFWIAFIKLYLEYKKYYPNGTNSEYYLELPDEVLYIIRYTPELVNHFFEQKTYNNNTFYKVKQTSITLPVEEFTIQSVSDLLNGIFGKDQLQTITLLIKVYVIDGKPSTLRCMTSQYLWGLLPYSHNMNDAHQLQRKTIVSLLTCTGIDNLITDIEFSSPQNTRYVNYLTQTCAYNSLQSGGNPNPPNEPIKKVSEILEQLKNSAKDSIKDDIKK